MVCYKCGNNTQVINSRLQKRSNHVWRRRACIFCDTTFTTHEGIDYAKSLVIETKSGQRFEPLHRDQLLLSLHKSLLHRPTALHDAGGLCTTILTKLAKNAHNGVITRAQIIQTTAVALHRFDKLAAQHYQAVHKL